VQKRPTSTSVSLFGGHLIQKHSRCVAKAASDGKLVDMSIHFKTRFPNTTFYDFGTTCFKGNVSAGSALII
jgi:hypothetical protein